MDFIHDLFKLKNKGPMETYLRTLLLWNPILAVLFWIVFSEFHNFLASVLCSLIISSTVINVCFGFTALVAWMNRITNWIPVTRNSKQSRAFYWSISILIMPLGLDLGFRMANLAAPHIGLPAVPTNFDNWRAGLVWGALIVGASFLIRSLNDARLAVELNELKLKAAENERLQAQIAALAAQMNPHLLFNTLNTIASLIPTDPEKAEATVVQLSELYRGVLDSTTKMVHPLSTELELCEAYLNLEKARFGDRLQTDIRVDADLNPQLLTVPALSIQPLVENAIKHGLGPRASVGRIHIRAYRDKCSYKVDIEDNGVGFGRSEKSGLGVSLKNCRERFKLHFGDKGRVDIHETEGGGTKVSLMFPISGAT